MIAGLAYLGAGITQDPGGGALRADRAVSARSEELGPEIAQQFRVVVSAMRADVAPDAAGSIPT